MNIVKISGGLGNQMFQYAFGKSLEKKTGVQTFFDVSSYDAHRERVLGLGDFKTKIQTASRREIANVLFPDSALMRQLASASRFFWKYSNNIVLEKGQYEFDQTALASRPSPAYFDGHWQNEKYFKDISDSLRSDFIYAATPDETNERSLEEIKNSLSVSLHIRRGDYIAIQNVSNICDASYYSKAIEYISSMHKDAVYFIFSDDMAWAKENLPKGYSYRYIENNGDHPSLDISLMSRCRHHIIANSTFSWWGAWINGNTDKIVVAPKLWHRIYTEADIVPSEWVKI